MYLIDTNVILEVLLDRSRAWHSLEFLKLVWRGEVEAFITDYAMHSIAVVLEHKRRAELIEEVFRALSSFKGLTLLQATIHQMQEVARLSKRTGLDFDDAYQLFFAWRLGLKVVSFDHHFDKHTERLEPRDVLMSLGVLRDGEGMTHEGKG